MTEEQFKLLQPCFAVFWPDGSVGHVNEVGFRDFPERRILRCRFINITWPEGSKAPATIYEETNDVERLQGAPRRPAHTEEFRDDINRIITNYPQMTVCETLGALELIKAELVERLRTSGPETDRR